MQPYLKALSDLADDNPKASGVVAVAGDEILAADLFSSPAIFRQVWPDLLESYVIDVLDREETPVGHHRDRDEGQKLNATRIQVWLNGLVSADQEPKHTPGDGHLYQLHGSRLVGTALVWDRGVVHIALFPVQPVLAEPQYDPLQFRRDRLQ